MNIALARKLAFSTHSEVDKLSLHSQSPAAENIKFRSCVYRKTELISFATSVAGEFHRCLFFHSGEFS